MITPEPVALIWRLVGRSRRSAARPRPWREFFSCAERPVMVTVTTAAFTSLRGDRARATPLICSAGRRMLAPAAMLPPPIARPDATAPSSLFIIRVAMVHYPFSPAQHHRVWVVIHWAACFGSDCWVLGSWRHRRRSPGHLP